MTKLLTLRQRHELHTRLLCSCGQPPRNPAARRYALNLITQRWAA